MADLPRIDHPGPMAPERMSSVRCRATEARVRLRSGVPLLDAMHEAAGGGAGWFVLKDLVAQRLSFVRPAPAPGDGHAAWYSSTTTLENARIVRAGAHLGRKNGQPFAHVHGIWQDEAGGLHMGHLLSHETFIAVDAAAGMWRLEGARLEIADDVETRFSLFRPVWTESIEQPNAVLATIRPNVVLHEGIGQIARSGGIDEGRVLGLGSLVGTSFRGCPPIESYATEVLLDECRVQAGEVELAGASVGFSGGFREGLVARDNVVCVTFELLLISGS